MLDIFQYNYLAVTILSFRRIFKDLKKKKKSREQNI